jgi:hypothetical protein
MCADQAHRVSDAQSNLEAGMSVVRGSDGGASAVAIELTNISTDNDVVLKVNTALSAFIILTVTDDQATVLSKPARTFSSEEVQRFDTVRIARGSSHLWRVPIADQLEPNALPTAKLKGRLVVNVLLLFKRTDDERVAEGEFDSSIVTLYDVDVLFTRTALSEGARTPTNGR